jgi:hypothetical protein
MLQESVIPAMSEDVPYDSDYNSSLKEQLLRLQSLQSVIAYLLERYEQPRVAIEARAEKA